MVWSKEFRVYGEGIGVWTVWHISTGAGLTGGRGGEGWHSARTIAHCHKCIDFTLENPKT